MTILFAKSFPSNVSINFGSVRPIQRAEDSFIVCAFLFGKRSIPTKFAKDLIDYQNIRFKLYYG